MSSFFTPRNVAITAGAVGAVAFMFPRTAKKVAPTDNIFETQGVKNIGDRYASGGGSNTHLPAVATPRGNPDSVLSNQERQKGISTPAFEQSHADQKVDSDGKVLKSFTQAQYGNDKGK